jgi:hypothetical protein
MAPSVPLDTVFPELKSSGNKAPKQKKENTKVQLFQESEKFEDYKGREQISEENDELIVEETVLKDIEPLSLEEQADAF